MSVTIEYLRKDDSGFITMSGTKVYLISGEEIKNVTSIGMPTKNVDGILEVTLTVALSNVKVLN